MASDNETDKSTPLSQYTTLNNDNPRSLITHVVLKGSNYEEWSHAIQISLRAKFRLGFVAGKVAEFAEGTDDNEWWWTINVVIVAWIFNTIEEKLRSTISYRNTAKQLWDDIKQRFSVGNGAKIYQLKAEVIDCKQQKDESIMTYFGRMKKIWDDIDTYDALPACSCCGCTCTLASVLEKRRENEHVREFLMGLDFCFAVVRSNILGMEPLINLNQVYSKLIQEEGACTFGNNKPRPVAFVALTQMTSRGWGVARHDDSKTLEKLKCIACNREGHTASTCFGVVGFPS